jgi:hypothetical protein
VLSLTLTARLSTKAPSDLAGILDEEIAFAFNAHCAETWHEWEQEQENKRFEALTGIGMVKQVTDAMNGETVTPSNLGDQSW